jgi:hypothetical protein
LNTLLLAVEVVVERILEAVVELVVLEPMSQEILQETVAVQKEQCLFLQLLMA